VSVAGGKVLADTNPRHGNSYFNTSLFSNEQLGQLGNSRRRFFHGPGLNNFDMALAKTTRFTESKELQLRLEAFHVFNHAQFSNPTGEINSQPVWIRNLSATCPDRAIGVRLLF
jgi:hypothetical protein